MNRLEIQSTMDKSLAPLVFSTRQQAAVFSIVKGETKVKKKLSAGFVLALILVFIAVTALAVASIWETGRLMAQTEQESGWFGNWPTERKVTVVSELVAEGYIKETPELKQMSEGALAEDEAVRVAHEAISAFIGEDAENASFLGIMNAAWGDFQNWTHEQQAWYSQVLTDVGANTDGETYYVKPTGQIGEQEAVAIAKRDIAKGFGVEASLLDGYRVEASFQIPEFAEEGDTQAYWYVCLDSGDADAIANGLPFSFFELFVHPETGEPLETTEEILAQRAAWAAKQNTALNEAILTFDESSGEKKAFEHWSLENKARWTKEIVPLILAELSEHPENADTLTYHEHASAMYKYGLPDEKAISQEQALTLAREALRTAYDLSDEQLELLIEDNTDFNFCVFYDVTDPARPLWKFLLFVPTEGHIGVDDAMAARVKKAFGTTGADGAYTFNLVYKAEINAYTGETARTLSMKYHPGSLEEHIEIY